MFGFREAYFVMVGRKEKSLLPTCVSEGATAVGRSIAGIFASHNSQQAS